MEPNLPESTAITIINNNNQIIPLPRDVDSKKKIQRNGNQLLRFASIMVRRKSAAKPKAEKEDVASKGMWKRFVDSMRPLHLQSNQLSPKHVVITPMIERFEDVLSSPISPIQSPAEGSSRYASANNLQELDPTSGDCDGDEIQSFGEDGMIDDKAEKFIAYFYEQMRLQQIDSFACRYDDWHTRSIG